MQKNFKIILLFWLIAVLIASIVLANSQFKSSSNDSKYYTALVVRYHQQSIQNILTPKWGENYWGFDPNSYNVDLFPGQLIMGIAVTKLGVPPEQALHILGMIFQVLSMFLLVKITGHFIGDDMASVLFYSLLFTPLAFSYNIRANHELGIMFFSFLALYSGLQLPKSKWWGLASICASVMLLWIKGPFLIFSLIFTSLGYYFSAHKNKKILYLIITLLIGITLIILSALGFDHLFIMLTGKSFLTEFWKIQITGRQIPYTSPYSFITLKLYNLYYYSWHYITYALPWSLLLLLIIKKNKNTLINFLKLRLSIFLLIAAGVFLAVFTVNSRHAARYVFPAYYLFASWVILAFFHCSLYFQKIHQKVLSLGIYYVAPVLWLVIFSLHFLQ